MKYIVTLNGKDYAVEVANGSAEIVSTAAAAPKAAAPVAAPAAAPAPKAAPAPAAAAPGAGTTVSAPMPGNVLKVNVKQGDKVTNGQVLLILEAMKMENEIFAPCDGTVTSVCIAVGGSVNSGDVMITIA